MGNWVSPKFALPTQLNKALEAVAPYGFPELARTPTGQFSLRLSIEGRDFLLNSRENPLKEALKSVDTTPLTPNTLLVFLGIGLGYHIQSWLKTHPAVKYLVLIEQDIRLFQTMLTYAPFAELLSGKTVIYYVGKSLSDVSSLLQKNIYVSYDRIRMVEHPVLVNAHPLYYTQLGHLIYQTFLYHASALGAMIVHRDEMVANMAANLLLQKESFDYSDLKAKNRDRPAIVIGAGPSLTQNIAEIKKYAESALLIAVDTAFGALVSAGISPHIVVAIDYSDQNYRHFESHLAATKKTVLVCTHGVCKKISREFLGSAVFIPTLNPLFRYFSVSEPDPMFHSVWSSSSLGLLLAIYMESDFIVLAGQDLSFQQDKLYAENTAKKGTKIKIHNGQRVLVNEKSGAIVSTLKTVLGYQGDVETTLEMLTTRKDLQDLMSVYPGHYYNLNQKGAIIEGTSRIDQADFEALMQNISPGQFQPPLRPEPVQHRPGLAQQLVQESQKIHSLAKEAVLLLQQGRLNGFTKASVQRLDALRKDILDSGYLFTILEYCKPERVYHIHKLEQVANPTLETQVELNAEFFGMALEGTELIIHLFNQPIR